MRIVGGEFRGRGLVVPGSQDIRPSSDRLRETLFDILTHRYRDRIVGVRVLDLFAGTGALGLEALSRGAAFALFVEEDVAARGLIRRNIEALGLTGRTRIFRRDATRLGNAGTVSPFDLVFVDPPYARGLGEKALAAARIGGWLKPEALCILEESGRTVVSAVEDFIEIERRTVGDSQLVFLRAPTG
jgi:16S rRNA (guanine966-N2)-methyltransferase